MKYCILFIFFTTPLTAQKFLQNIYFSYEVRNKWSLYTIPDKQEFVQIEPYNEQYARFTEPWWDDLIKYYTIGYRVTPKFEVEFSTAHETYWGGFKYYSTYFPNEDNNLGRSVDVARNYSFRFTYKIFPLKKLSINTSFAYILSNSEYWDGIIKFGNQIWPSRSGIDTSMILYQIIHEEHRTDLGLKKHFHALDGRVILEYQPFKLFSIYYGGGYTQGLNTFARMRVTYWVNNEPRKTSTALVNGSNYYWCFGVKMNLFELHPIKGIKKAIERSEAKTKQQREAREKKEREAREKKQKEKH